MWLQCAVWNMKHWSCVMPALLVSLWTKKRRCWGKPLLRCYCEIPVWKGLGFHSVARTSPPMPCLSWWSFFEQGGRIASLALGPSLTWGQVWVAGGSLLEAAGLGHGLGAVWDTATGGARATLVIILKEKQTWMPVRIGNEVNTAVSKSSA